MVLAPAPLRDFLSRRKEPLAVAAVFLSLFLIGTSELGYVSYLRRKVGAKLPAEWSRHFFNGSTNLLVPWLNDDPTIYAAKVNQIRLHGFPYDPFIKENRSFGSWIPDAATLYILAFLTAPFGKLQCGWMAATYLLYAGWFLLYYFLFRGVFKEKTTGLLIFASLLPVAFADAFLTFDFLSDLNPATFSLGKWLWHFLNFGFVKSGLDRHSMPSHLLTSFLLFLWFVLFLLHLLYAEKRDRLGETGLGLLAGFLALVHYPEWGFAMAVLGIVWLYSFFKEGALSGRRTALTWILVFAALSSAVFFSLTLFSQDPSKTDSFSWYFVHFRVRLYSYFLLAIALAAFRRSRSLAGNPQRALFWAFIACALAASFILFHMDLILRRPMNFGIMQRGAALILGLAFSGWLIELSDRFEGLARRGACLAGALLLVVFFNVKSFAEKHYKLGGLPLAWEQALDWLKTNGGTDGKVLLLSPALNKLLPLYTPLKLEVAEPFFIFSPVSVEENLRRTAVLLKTLGVPFATFQAEFFGPPRVEDFYPLHYGGDIDPAFFRKGWGVFICHRNDGETETLRKLRAYYDSAEPLREDFYVWLNQDEERYVNPKPALRKSWSLVYENPGVRLYRAQREVSK